jgi:hypothetical protein
VTIRFHDAVSAALLLSLSMLTAAVTGCDTGSGDGAEHAPVSAVSVAVHADVATVLVVDWTQDADAAAAWLEFTFEDDVWHRSPARARSAGPHSEVLLGIPPEQQVLLQIANEIDGETRVSEQQWVGITGELPDGVPRPQLGDHQPSLASSHPWLLASVSEEGEGDFKGYYWVTILDRQARVVWYYQVPPGATTLMPRVARDGTHLIVDESQFWNFGSGEPSLVRRMTLDRGRYEAIELPGMAWAFDESDEGSILFDQVDPDTWQTTLVERLPDGSFREIWDCTDWIGEGGTGTWDCATNAVNWWAGADTVLWSMFQIGTVVEVDRATGDLVGQWGQLEGSWGFDPPEATFMYQHFPYYTEAGTMMAMIHLFGRAGPPLFCEYAEDPEAEVLELVWSYGEGLDLSANGLGEATRLANGNTLANFGQGSVLHEVTPDKQLAWEIAWDYGSDLGHTTLLDDLYALNGLAE